MTNINIFTSEKTNKPLHEPHGTHRNHGLRGAYEGHQADRIERKISNERIARVKETLAAIAMTEEVQEFVDTQDAYDLAA